MKSFILLNEADKLRLRLLLDHETPPPTPDPVQHQLLLDLLKASVISDDPEELENHTGFHDSIVVASTADPRDYFRFSIAMPRESDVDHDQISILAPISLAILGRGLGDEVTWETPAGERQMKIISITKCDEEGSATEPAAALLEATASGA